MEDPNLIAILIPFDKYNWAENAFCLRDNEGRYLPPTREIPEGPTISSREATPAPEQVDDDHCKYDSTRRLQLTFGEEPKDARGYCFGTNPQKCDVLLGNRGAHGISGLHFWITFDDTIDKEKPRLILKDSSTHGTAVGYNDQAIKEVRRHFTWILDLKKEKGKWEIVVNAQELRFKVELASHETCKAEYDEKVEKFLKRKSTALPPVDGLGMDSYTTTAQPSQVSTPKQIPVYISERELGHGSFGRVDRVIDVSTGAIYARKGFHEPQRGKNEERRREQEEHWLDRVRREIRIMRENSHENIVQVVASQDSPLPFLVMPYFSLGNLEDLHSESPITGEEAIFVLFQALNALRYLHPRGVAHRDLKPANVLVESRFPLSVKLADFGLANDQPDLKTLCGTRLYTAPEVYLGKRYTASIDLWSLGVIVFQYVYGFPEARQKRRQHKRSKMEEWGLTWCRRIVDKANDWDSEDLIDLLVTGMLRLRPEERLSADACLAKGYELGLFHGHSHDSGTAIPTQRTALQGGTSDDDGSTTILLGAIWDTEEGSKHSAKNRTGCRNPDHTSGVLESRSLRGPSNGNDRGSQLGSFGPAFNQWGSNGQSSADLSYPLLKRQRSPVVGSAKNSQQRPDQTSTNRGSATVIPLVTERHLSKRNIQNNTKTTLAGNLDDQNEGRRKVTDFDARHIQLEIDNKIILMRKEDCFLNATQILTLANKNASDRKYLLSLMKKQTEIQVLPPVTDIPYSCSWVNFQHGLILCQHLKLEHQLQPLINYGLRAQRDNCKRVEQIHDYLTEKLSRYFVINVLPQPVTVRRSDFRINASHICRAAGQPRSEVTKVRKEYGAYCDIVSGSTYHQGTYVDPWVGVKLCRRYGLIALEKELHTWKDVPQESVKEPEVLRSVKRRKLSGFIEITGFSNHVMVRIPDFRVNASHIIKLAGQSKTTLANFKELLNPEAYEILRGNKNNQGTYVNIDVGVELCRKYGLSELEKRLHSLRQPWERPMMAAEPGHTGSQSQTRGQLPGSTGSGRTSAQNKDTQSRVVWIRDHPRASSEGPDIDGPMQAGDAHGMDSDSDATGSEDSVTPHEPDPIQRKSQLVPSTRCEKDAASSCHSLLDNANLRSYSAESPHNEVWDSQSEHSKLTKVEPELRPSTWRTASHYGSLSDLFAPA